MYESQGLILNMGMRGTVWGEETCEFWKVLLCTGRGYRCVLFMKRN